jgi:hypothetical protein
MFCTYTYRVVNLEYFTWNIEKYFFFTFEIVTVKCNLISWYCMISFRYNLRLSHLTWYSLSVAYKLDLFNYIMFIIFYTYIYIYIYFIYYLNINAIQYCTPILNCNFHLSLKTFPDAGIILCVSQYSQ